MNLSAASYARTNKHTRNSLRLRLIGSELHTPIQLIEDDDDDVDDAGLHPQVLLAHN